MSIYGYKLTDLGERQPNIDNFYSFATSYWTEVQQMN